MPDPYLCRVSHNYLISPIVLKHGLQSVMRGAPLSVLRCPIIFTDCPHLQKLFGWIYCWYHGMNAKAAEILERNAPNILKAILIADQKRMEDKIDLEPDDHPWKESNEKIEKGARFHVDEEVFKDYDKELLAATSFKMTSSSASVTFTQLYAYQEPPFTSAGVERSRCELDIPLAQLKTQCLRAYIAAEHRAARIPDLRECDFSSFSVEGINFQGTKMRATQFRQLLQTRAELDFRGVQLTDSVAMHDMHFIHCTLDKSLALQLIGMGGNRRMVLIRYLQTELQLGRTRIDLEGFDLSDVEIRYTKGGHLEDVVIFSADQSHRRRLDHIEEVAVFTGSAIMTQPAATSLDSSIWSQAHSSIAHIQKVNRPYGPVSRQIQPKSARSEVPVASDPTADQLYKERNRKPGDPAVRVEIL